MCNSTNPTPYYISPLIQVSVNGKALSNAELCHLKSSVRQELVSGNSTVSYVARRAINDYGRLKVQRRNKICPETGSENVCVFAGSQFPFGPNSHMPYAPVCTPESESSCTTPSFVKPFSSSIQSSLVEFTFQQLRRITGTPFEALSAAESACGNLLTAWALTFKIRLVWQPVLIKTGSALTR